MTDRDPHDRSVPDSWRTELGRFDLAAGTTPECAQAGCLHLAQRVYGLYASLRRLYCPVHSDSEPTS